MGLCVEWYLDTERHYRIADLGSRRVVQKHLVHRTLLEDYNVDYIGLTSSPDPTSTS